jgi:3D (Asp-Asp-Asp) domain-containing protein
LTYPELRNLALAVVAAFILIVLLAACGTTGTHPLPVYEPPLTKNEFQNVRTTAYTDTEADHVQYGARNALGGELHAAGPAIRRAENATTLPADLGEAFAYQRAAYSGAPHQPFSLDDPPPARRAETPHGKNVRHGSKRRTAVRKPPAIGSAAADWSRWPLGTTFRLLSTGQIYRVDDYGWALSGRNTIDLYMATQRDMNAWGARQEPIEILKWGDPEQSLRILEPRQKYRHIRRMVLELEGSQQQAAALR